MKLKRLLFPLLTLLLVLLLIPRAQAEEVATSAKACIIIDEASGRVLLSHNAETPLPMASTTKVMTALLALERGNLGDPVTCSRNASVCRGRAFTFRREKRFPCATCSMG